MEFTPIVPRGGIKNLLLEEAKRLEKGEHPRLIILSKERFRQFIGREDVEKVSYDCEDRCDLSDDMEYRVYENENMLICKFYSIVSFQHIGGLYIVKKLFGCDE